MKQINKGVFIRIRKVFFTLQNNLHLSSFKCSSICAFEIWFYIKRVFSRSVYLLVLKLVLKFYCISLITHIIMVLKKLYFHVNYPQTEKYYL